MNKLSNDNSKMLYTDFMRGINHSEKFPERWRKAYDTKFGPDASTNLYNFIPRGYGSSLTHGILPASLTTGLGIGILGAGIVGIKNLFSSDSKENKRKRLRNYTLAAALSGLGLGGFLGHALTPGGKIIKLSYTQNRSVEQAIHNDPSLSVSQKMELISQVTKLPIMEYADLHRLILSAKGAALGALVAKFLLNKGITGMIISAIASGFTSYLFTPRQKQREVDYFGRPRML